MRAGAKATEPGDPIVDPVPEAGRACPKPFWCYYFYKSDTKGGKGATGGVARRFGAFFLGLRGLGVSRGLEGFTSP